MSAWSFGNHAYEVEVSADGLWAVVQGQGHRSPVRLSLLSSLSCTAGVDETVSVSGPQAVEGSLPPEVHARARVTRRSTLWGDVTTELDCGSSWLELRVTLSPGRAQGQGPRAGEGPRLTDVTLLGGRSLMARAPGMIFSGSELPQLFSPNPEDPRLVVHAAATPAVAGGCGDSLPGRGHWFFTPAPLYFALGQGKPPAHVGPGAIIGSGPNVGSGPNGAGRQSASAQWVGLGLVGPVSDMWFTEVAFVPADQGFALRLAYEGHFPVRSGLSLPAVLVLPGLDNPYDGIRHQRQRLLAEGHIKRAEEGGRPEWWHRPMFCGWGAQCYLAKREATDAKAQCTQDNYDRFMGELKAKGVVPGTVVVDDGWQAHYGRVAPAAQRWPDLKGWVAERHRQGQRVLMWWKAWDPEGVPTDWCITNPAGVALALDPAHPQGRRLLEANITEILSPDGYDADGLKVDFTGRTPTGYALAHAGPWGLALLHEYLAVVYGAAKKARPDALVITHAVNAAFADVADMVRLNDILRLDESSPDSPVVYQMKYRAAVARAACPELLIDTDDWCAPDLGRWRQYMQAKAGLGVPTLYYTTHLDRSGEALDEQDYQMLRDIFAAIPKGAP